MDPVDESSSAEDEEKYWYESSIKGYKNLFNDEEGIGSSIKDQQNVEKSKDIIRLLNGTRLDWMKESPDLIVNWDGETIPPDVQGTSTFDNADTLRQAIMPIRQVKAKSARFGGGAMPTQDDTKLLTSSLDTRRYQVKADTSLISQSAHFEPPLDVMSISRNLAATHISLLPTSFYDPCEFDDTEVDSYRVISDLMINKPSQLTSVRTQIQKERLFKSALTRGDGNAIIAVILYLKQTMSKQFFQKILTGKSYLKNQDAKLARDHYVRYVKFCMSLDEAIKELRDLNMSEEALNFYMSRFSSSFEEDLGIILSDRPTSAQMVDLLRSRYKELLTFFGQLGDIPYGKSVSLHMYMIDVKKRIFSEYNSLHPGKALTEPLIEVARIKSPIELLRLCLRNDNRIGDLKLPDPTHICERFNLTDRQHAFSIVSVLAELNAWSELNNQLLKKGVASRLSSPGLSKSTQWHIMCDIAFAANAPASIISDYIRYIPDVEQRFDKAQKFNCYDLAVECLKELKNKEKLEFYRKTIPNDQPAYTKATAYLENMPATSAQISTSGMNFPTLSKDKFRFRDLFQKK